MTDDDRPLLGALNRGRARARALSEAPVLRQDDVSVEVLGRELEEALALTSLESPLLLRERARVQLRSLERQAPSDLVARATDGLVQLRAIEETHFGPLRTAVREKKYGPQELLRDLADRSTIEQDLFVDRLLGIHDPPPEEKVSDLENSPYLASSLQQIRPLLELVGKDDVFFDLGSGLGKVVFMVQWFTGARAIGVEYDPSLGAVAKRARNALGFDVELLVADARTIDFQDGTFFYLFEPFRGEVLDSVFRSIGGVADHHPVRLAARWVTDTVFVPAPWMREVAVSHTGLRLFEGGPT